MRFNSALLGMLIAAFPIAAEAADAPPNLSVIATIPGPDGGWDYATIDSRARRLYVAHGDTVMAVDLDNGKVDPKLVEGKHLHAVLPLGNGRVLSTNGAGNTATVFDGASGTILASIPTAADPDAAILDPASGLVLIMDGHSGVVTLIDPKTATSAGEIMVGGTLEFAVADGHGKAFINIEDKGEVAVVDIKARKVLTRYKLPNCEEPSGLALDPQTGMMVAACANNIAVVLKAEDGTVVATPAIKGHPDAAIFDPRRKLFLVPCGEGYLTVISATSTPETLGSIPTAAGARTAALDEKTGKLYLPTADLTPPPAGQKHPGITPGTFRILVVGEK